MFSQYPSGSITYWIYLYISISCKVAVPVFLMITGALLLKKQERALWELWRRRIGKMVVVLIGFSFVYYLRQIQLGNENFNLKRFFCVLYDSDWNFSYWYLYVCVSLLITLPFLRALVHNLDKKYFYYMMTLAICFEGLIPILQYLISNNQYTLNEGISVEWLITRSVIYPCMGYFLEHENNKFLNKKAIIALWCGTFMTICISCVMTYYKTMITGEFDMTNSQSFLIVSY